MKRATAVNPSRSEKRHRTPPRSEGTPADRRDTIHANWGRFLHANPKHRLTDGGRTGCASYGTCHRKSAAPARNRCAQAADTTR